MSHKNIVTREPQQKRGKETKKALLEAGLCLIAEQGYHQINSKDIAKKASVSIGSFYAYFEDKNILFLELVAEYKNTTTLMDAEHICDISQKPIDYITFFLEHKLKLARQYPPEFHKEIHYQRTRDLHIKKLYDEHKAKELLVFQRILENLKDYLTVSDLESASQIIFSLYEDMISTLLEVKDLPTLNNMLNEYTTLLCRYLFGEIKNHPLLISAEH